MNMEDEKSIYFQGKTSVSLNKLRKQLHENKVDDSKRSKKMKLHADIRDNGVEQNIPPSVKNAERYKYDFYDSHCEQLARRLLGKTLVRILGDVTLKGRIVETECYPGGEDRASHSFNNKQTPRNKPMFMKPGTTYVYLTYGMYHCFNISCQGDGAAVLIRALEPLEGIDRIEAKRLDFLKRKKKLKEEMGRKPLKTNHLCNGPGKLTVGFEIDMSVNEQDLSSWEGLYIEAGDDIDSKMIVASHRIGIDSYDEPWKSKPWRFYIYNNPCVSKYDRLKEKALIQLNDQT